MRMVMVMLVIVDSVYVDNDGRANLAARVHVVNGLTT